MTDRTRACLDCDTDITHRHHNARRCDSCSSARNKFSQSQQAPPKGTCAVNDDECVTGRLRRGYCSKHYIRQKRYGTSAPARSVDHFTRYRVTETDCWEWTGPLYDNGYGHSPPSTGDRLAHRAFYKKFIGPIPDDLELDHVCRNRACVRPHPDHLEPVTRSINIQRGWDARRAGRCANDLHDLLTDDDWYVDPSTGARRCRACWQVSYRKAGQAYRDRRTALTA